MTGAIQSTLSTALSGLTAASQKAAGAATAIAGNAPGTDLAAQIVNLDVAKTEFKANAFVVKTTDDMQKSLLHSIDIKA